MYNLLIAFFILCFGLTANAATNNRFPLKIQPMPPFIINSEFKDIDLADDIPSGTVNYMDKQFIVIENSKPAELILEDVSYFSTFKMFGGDNALQNNLIRLYNNGDFEAYVEEYAIYGDAIIDTSLKEKFDLLFAISARYAKLPTSYQLLEQACLEGNMYRDEACDKYAEILWNEQSYTRLTKLGQEIDKQADKIPFTKYFFTHYLYSYAALGEYNEVDTLLENNPDQIFADSDFNDMRVVAAYHRGDYETAAQFVRYSTDNIAFISADSLLNSKKYSEGYKMIEDVPDENNKNYLYAKYHIARQKYDDAETALAKITSQNERLDLLKFYVYREYPNLDDAAMAKFALTDDITNYTFFYKGLELLSKNEYGEAAGVFANIKSPDDLALKASFYNGIALLHINTEEAEKSIAEVLNKSDDINLLAKSRYTLAQMYFKNKNMGETMQLLDGCETNYCRQLRSEIYVNMGNPEEALQNLLNVNTPQAHITNAIAYYNLKKYDLAKSELKKADTTTHESERLRMRLLFLADRTNEAIKIINDNDDYPPIRYDGAHELLLDKQYKQSANLLNSSSLPEEMTVVKAQSLALLGNVTQANKLFVQLEDNDNTRYDALYGLIAIEQRDKAKSAKVAQTVKKLSKTKDFPNKDLLLSELAAAVAADGNQVLLVQIINMFFPEYKESTYAADMYALRAKLFYRTARFKECLNDINAAISLKPALAKTLAIDLKRCTVK